MLGLGLGLSLGQSRGPSWSPLESGDVVAWYRMDLGVATSGSNITAVADQSGVGSGKNLVAANGNPTIAVDAAYGGKHVASFAGAPRLEPSGVWSSPISQAFTIYVVGQALVGSIFDGDDSGRANLQSAGTWLMYAGSGFVDSGVGSNTPAVVCCVYKGASSSVYVGDFATADATGNPGVDTLARLAIGDIAGRSNSPVTGKCAEAIVCSGDHDVDAAKRALFRAYFASRYGL